MIDRDDPYPTLRDATLAFAAAHSHPAIAPFKQELTNWGEAYAPVAPVRLTCADWLAPALEDTPGGAERRLLERFLAVRDRLRWEQTYSKADGLVGDDMLNGYGFAEVIGLHGPYVSKRVRSGVCVWGPSIHYPTHRHQAEEVYVPLAGGAEFTLEGAPTRRYGVGDVVHLAPMRRHGFATRAAPLVVFYIWRAGDLREVSRFD